MKKLVIVGNGGFAREVKWPVERIKTVSSTWELLGVIDENMNNSQTIVNDELVVAYQEELYVAIAIGTSGIREKIYKNYKDNANIKFVNLIAPSVVMYSNRVRLGEDNIICAGTIITVDIKIGNCNIINLDCCGA